MDSSSSSSPSTSSSPTQLIHVFWHEGMLNHDTGTGVFDTLVDPGFLEILEKHPENSDRVKNMVSILKKGPISPYISWHSGRLALIPELLSFHTPEYINELIEADKAGGKKLCAGTILSPGSWDASLLAAGTTLKAMKHILDGNGKIAYALVRPPGHHAQPTRADGYCFLNNAGLAINLALDSGCERVVVIDIDVHYGNGTAEGYYRSDNVLTISLHMNHGSWGSSHPQDGSIDELGEGRGLGFNLNIPLPNGTGDRGYMYAMNELVAPAVEKFEPSMMVLVVGQDSSAFDPNGRQCLTMEGYREIGRLVRRLADKYSKGRILIVQEGGYHITYSAYCLHATLEGILGLHVSLLSDPVAYYPEDETLTIKVVDSVKEYWKSSATLFNEEKLRDDVMPNKRYRMSEDEVVEGVSVGDTPTAAASPPSPRIRLRSPVVPSPFVVRVGPPPTTVVPSMGSGSSIVQFEKSLLSSVFGDCSFVPQIVPHLLMEVDRPRFAEMGFDGTMDWSMTQAYRALSGIGHAKDLQDQRVIEWERKYHAEHLLVEEKSRIVEEKSRIVEEQSRLVEEQTRLVEELKGKLKVRDEEFDQAVELHGKRVLVYTQATLMKEYLEGTYRTKWNPAVAIALYDKQVADDEAEDEAERAEASGSHAP